MKTCSAGSVCGGGASEAESASSYLVALGVPLDARPSLKE